MSDSDIPAGNGEALVTMATPSSDDTWSAWDLAGADPQANDLGMDQVNAGAGGGDWFPSIPATGVMAAALSAGHDSDPLVNLPSSDIAQVADGLDAGELAAMQADAPEPNVASYALHHPIDHSMPIDHVDWHLGGLLA